MRTLITGVTGFVGGHLAAHLVQCGHDVIGLARHPPVRAIAGVRYRVADLTDAVLGEEAVDAVVHLAGVRRGVCDADIYQTNVVGTARLLDSLAPAVRTIIVGSSAIYGDSSDGTPLTETAPLRPTTAYGVSKASADLMAAQRFAASGAAIVRARLFNVIGPGQRGDFLMATCARQLIEIERGTRPPVLALGNLDATRDFIDVRDVVLAIVAMIERGEPGEAYNVCSGHGVPVRIVVDMLVRSIARNIEVQSTPRDATDVPYQAGSYDKLHARTGWSPRRSLDVTLQDIVADWRSEPQS